MSEPIISSVNTLLCYLFSARGLLMEHDCHFDVFLPESVRKTVVGGCISDFVSFRY